METLKRPYIESVKNAHEKNPWNKSNTTMRVLPDRTIHLVRTVDGGVNGDDQKISMFVDPITRMPTRFTRIDDPDGKNIVVDSTENILEEFSGIYRVKSQKLKAQEVSMVSFRDLTNRFNDDPIKSNALILVDVDSQIDFEWLQFNEKQLKFPDIDELGNERKRWVELLKLTPSELAAERKLIKATQKASAN